MIGIRSSITLKISLLVLGSTCLVFALVLARSYTNSRKLIRAEAETSARNLTALLANDVEQEFLIVESAARNLAGSLEIGNLEEKTLLERIRKMVSQNAPVFGSAVAFQPDAFKRGVARFAPYFYKSKEGIRFEQLGTAWYDYFSKDWFAVPVKLKKPIWTDPYFDEGGGNVAMTTYSYPMFRSGDGGAGQRPTAVVTADISLKQLNDLVNSIQVYESGFCFVTSDKGIAVTSRFPERVMRMTIHDVVKMYKHPRAREIVESLLSKESGFEDIGSAITGVDSAPCVYSHKSSRMGARGSAAQERAFRKGRVSPSENDDPGARGNRSSRHSRGAGGTVDQPSTAPHGEGNGTSGRRRP